MENDPAPADQRMSERTRPVDVVAMLGGGDLRSIGRANEVAALVAGQPALFGRLINAMKSSDPIVSARGADAAEKVSALQPELLVPYKLHLMHDLARHPQPEVRWHVALMLARLTLDPSELAEVVALLESWLNDRSSIVKTNSLQSLADLAQRHPRLQPQVVRHLQEVGVTGTPAMRARSRKLLKQLAR